MLKITYIPVDDEHEPAVVEYDTLEMNSTDTGIRFIDSETGMERMIHYKKFTKAEFVIVVPKAFVNRANNIIRLKKKNSINLANATVH